MLTVHGEIENDHYADFIETLSFLAGTDEAAAIRNEMAHFREALLRGGATDLAAARAAKRQLEQRLRRVIVRTERLSISDNRNGMLVEVPPSGLRLEPDDLRSYAALDRLARRFAAGDVLDYWKSTPYFVNFMDDYKLLRVLEASDGAASAALQHYPHDGGRLLPWESYRRYRPVEPGNPRLRSLLAETVDKDAWKLLWLPPSLSYYSPGGAYKATAHSGLTKQLVFSAWTVVPKSIAALVSYEAERRMMTSRRGRSPANTPEARERLSALLRFARNRGRLVGMPVFTLIYPSAALAGLLDPRQLAHELGRPGEVPERAHVLAAAAAAVGKALAPLLAGRAESGGADERWYWAAPMLLDAQLVGAAEWQPAATTWTEADEDARSEQTALAAHLHEAEELLRAERGERASVEPLGQPPDDLVDVIARVALASPATAALRALARSVGTDTHDTSARSAAARVAWGMRSLFNQPEVSVMLGRRGTQPYWRRVLDYCLDGNLQATLDEYAHVLLEWRGVVHLNAEQKLAELASTIHDVLALRRVTYAARQPEADDTALFSQRRMGGRFALRYGDERSDDGKALHRRGLVHAAFNSPFWPFVLATTSIGQEGLDFHLYCHSVVHWNLPSNPVDLEQCEGRVHRYKGHAVRKNLASTLGVEALASPDSDPWRQLFALGAAQRQPGENDLVPAWVYTTPDGARIERHVPALPLSRDLARLADLRQSLALYRLAFGQPRQEDLLDYLRERYSADEIKPLLAELRIDLAPDQGAAVPADDDR